MLAASPNHAILTGKGSVGNVAFDTASDRWLADWTTLHSYRLLPTDRSSTILNAVARLRVDGWTAEVVSGLREHGVEPVLLKGPVIRGWLYADEPQERCYHDVDLIVAPHDRASAERALSELGFSEPTVELRDEWPLHARAWSRSADNAAVDLHRCLHGMESLPPERVWAVLAEHLESRSVAGVDVSVPDEVVRTLHVALHVGSKDQPGSTPWVDLERAVVQVDRSIWERAADLARQLGIEAEMGTRLRAVPRAAALTEALGLPSGGAQVFELRTAARDTGAGAAVFAVARLRDLRGRDRLRYAFQKLLPPPPFMRAWTPVARRGTPGLVVAYALRIAWCARRAPAAITGWRRTRRRLR